jgi:hypothetical protein
MVADRSDSTYEVKVFGVPNARALESLAQAWAAAAWKRKPASPDDREPHQPNQDGEE